MSGGVKIVGYGVRRVGLIAHPPLEINCGIGYRFLLRQWVSNAGACSVRLWKLHNKRRINWFANLRLAPLFAAILLCGQILATAHAATYADADHLHDGVPCIISVASKQLDALDLASSVPSLDRVKSYHCVDTVFRDTLVENSTVSIQTIRGPPAFS
jgi:hypothetical protein